MKYMSVLLIFFISVFFTACSSKNQVNFNKQMKSISLNENIIVSKPAQTVKSPVSLNLGFGRYISRHIGIHAGTSVRPDIKNSEGLNFQRALNKFDISLENQIKQEFKKQMREDSFYKNKFVPFGANNVINLYVKKYEIDESFFSNTAYIKIYMQVRIVNTQNGKELYLNDLVNEITVSSRKYKLSDIFRDKSAFLELLNSSISNLVKKHIKEMKEI